MAAPYSPKPVGPAQVRWGHPLAHGLKYFAILNQGYGQPRELVQNTAGTLRSNATWVSREYGPALSFAGGTDECDFPRSRFVADLGITNQFTVSCRWRRTGGGNIMCFGTNDNDTSGTDAEPCSLGYVSGGFWAKISDSAGTGAEGSFGSPSLNTWYHQVVTYNGATARIFVDGNQLGSFSQSGNVYDTDALIALGSRGDYGGFNWSGQVDHAAVWNYAMSAEQVSRLTLDPLAPIRPARSEYLYWSSTLTAPASSKPFYFRQYVLSRRCG